MNPVYVCAGTQTGVGKTYASAKILETWSRRGIKSVGLKPVESGCSGSTPDETEDGVILANASGQEMPQAALVRLRNPLAPPLAAEIEQKRYDIQTLIDRMKLWIASADVALVESAGGLMSPMSWSVTNLDFASLMAARVILVAENRLGVLHDVVSAVRLLEMKKLQIAGIVLNQVDAQESDAARYTVGSLRKMGLELPLTHLTHQEKSAEETSAQTLTQDGAAPFVDWALGLLS